MTTLDPKALEAATETMLMRPDPIPMNVLPAGLVNRLGTAITAYLDALPQPEGDEAAKDARIAELESALVWCSGSADFQEGGRARVGWLKLCQPLLDTLTPKEQESEG